MRKQELVHLHALCSQVRDHVEHRYDVPETAFDRYDGTDVAPTAVHRRKEAHEEALDRLLRDLSGVFATHIEGGEGTRPPSTEAPADRQTPTE